MDIISNIFSQIGVCVCRRPTVKASAIKLMLLTMLTLANLPKAGHRSRIDRQTDFWRSLYLLPILSASVHPGITRSYRETFISFAPPPLKVPKTDDYV